MHLHTENNDNDNEDDDDDGNDADDGNGDGSICVSVFLLSHTHIPADFCKKSISTSVKLPAKPGRMISDGDSERIYAYLYIAKGVLFRRKSRTLL